MAGVGVDLPVKRLCERRGECPFMADVSRFTGARDRQRVVRQRLPVHFKRHWLARFVTMRLAVLHQP